ncbi:sugar phosphate isomerase/epimerase family protein [Fundicoccus culcitae]|uniref:Sugar phosphate isomerase/epimerase n=1 Tax=Fundicoccus culcitae TaxID=2969821 RepID=A0ABY5P3R6_9LACT|nr:sugar phosphate isomerase/epimerase [Fundicoccus culcitae]UUX33384.1 sugar phosphate isomerase/epimerase [Fundicoccus culcitae]
MDFLYQFRFGLDIEKLESYADYLLGNNIFKGIEISANPFNEFDEYLVDYFKVLRKVINKYQPIVTAHLPVLDYGNRNQEVVDLMIDILKRSIADTREFGIKQYVLHAATTGNQDLSDRIDLPEHKLIYDIAMSRRKEVYDRSISVIKELAVFTDKLDYDTHIGIENVLLDVEVVYSPEDQINIIELANHPKINAVYDVGHANRAKQNLQTFPSDIATHLGHIHINDNDGLCDLHALPGTLNKGMDYELVFNSLKQANYDGTMLIEAFYENKESLVDAKEHLEKFM